MSTKIDLIENSWFMIEYKNYWYVVRPQIPFGDVKNMEE